MNNFLAGYANIIAVCIHNHFMFYFNLFDVLKLKQSHTCSCYAYIPEYGKYENNGSNLFKVVIH